MCIIKAIEKCKFISINIKSIFFHSIFGNNVTRKLCDRGHYELALDITVQQINKNTQNNNYSSGPAILIAGVARTGKSILAKSIAQERCYLVINLDRYRNIWNKKSLSSPYRVQLKKYFLTELLRTKRCGLVIEGDELITDDMPNLNTKIISHSLNFEYLLEFKKNYSAVIIIVGSSSAKPEEKALGIIESAKKNGCWAADNMGIDDIMRLSKVIISMSKEISITATKLKLNYIDLHPKNFHNEIISSKLKTIKF